jgi:DNA-directed RNA polymerase specialized sigma24 family protein
MATGTSGAAVRDLGTLLRSGAVGGLSNARLLERFLASTGEDAEDAFRAVVERHGSMVLGVCRRILGDEDDAEDAFQATFLVLARKARSIARRELLANWLHGVAAQTARELKATRARRLAREGQVNPMARAQVEPDGLC